MLEPDFLIAGAPRCGTTLLCNILARNPAVAICDPKEPHFLAYGGTELNHTGPGDEHTINRRAVLEEQAWRSLFDLSAQYKGDGSVTTLYEYGRSIPAIRRYCPRSKIVVMLRDPATRAHSAHMYMVGRGFETLEFRQALERETERIRLGYQHVWHYAAQSRYGKALAAFTSAFDADQLYIDYYETLVLEPRQQLEAIHAFLGIDPVEEALGLGQVINQSGRPRSALATGVLKWLGGSRLRKPGRAVIPFALRERLRGGLLERTEMSADDRQAAIAAIGPIEGLPTTSDMPAWAREWSVSKGDAPPPIGGR